MFRLAMGLVAVLAACTQSAADEAVTFCQPLCRCVDVPLPAEQRDCVASCTRLFELQPLGSACVNCVVAHADRCTSLIDECDPFCADNGSPLQSYEDAMSPESRSAR